MKKIFLLLSLSCICTLLSAQSASITGTVQSLQNKRGINGVTVRLYSGNKDSLVKATSTDSLGNFLFRNLSSLNYRLVFTHVSFDSTIRSINYTGEALNIGLIQLGRKSEQLQTIVITAKTPPVTQKSDTIEYAASQFKVNPDANAEDLVQKMPGITVDNSGKVTAQGEDVKKVLIDGKEFFGDDATLALRNLPAEIIDKIQVFDRLSDQAQFTGFDDGSTYKAINIVTKGGIQNSQFGKIFGGYGTDNRYMAGGNINLFDGDRRISLIGLSNNVNQQNFSSQDILGVVATPAGGRGGRGGGGGGGGGRGGGGAARGGGGAASSTDNFLVGQQAGINTTNSFGLNYIDQWGKKLKINGSYFFNQTQSISKQLSNTQYFITADSSQSFRENSLSESNNNNHRMNVRLEYALDSHNVFILSPSLSFQQNNAITNNTGIYTTNTTKLLSDISNNSRALTDGYNLRNSLIYRHAFDKRGRSFSIGLNMGINNKSQDRFTDAFTAYYASPTAMDTLQQFTHYLSVGKNIGASFNFTEPVGKGLLQLSYNPTYSLTDADLRVFQYDSPLKQYSLQDSSLSNVFENEIRTQNAGIAYRLGNRDQRFSIGANYQSTALSNSQLFPILNADNKTFSNILPNANARLKLSTRSSLNVLYRANVSTPSISQLQNVFNVSDPLFISTGNPDLKQQYSHNLSTRFTYTNTTKGQTLMGNLFLQNTSNYIANASFLTSKDSALTPSVTLYKGSQLFKPINLDGYMSVRSLLTFGTPVKLLKSNLNLNAGFNYNILPGLVNGTNSTTNNYVYNLGFVLGSNISERIDFTTSFSAGYNVSQNSLQPDLSNKYYSHTARVRLNLLSNSEWKFESDLTNQFYDGLTEEFNQNFWLLNAGIAKKFLKDNRAEIKLSVFDILKQNQSISRNITETYIQDLQTEVLQQYFMLSFTYNIRHFQIKK